MTVHKCDGIWKVQCDTQVTFKRQTSNIQNVDFFSVKKKKIEKKNWKKDFKSTKVKDKDDFISLLCMCSWVCTDVNMSECG